MTIRKVVLMGDPVLNTAAAAVTEFDETLRTLVADMYETMDAAGGVGLAANQVGVAKRVFVFDCQGLRGHIVNPQWCPIDESMQHGPEGCLSIPGVQQEVERFNNVVASGFDMEGRRVAIRGTGLLARCIQHETDHLEGILFLDRMGRAQRKQAMAEIRQSSWFRER